MGLKKLLHNIRITYKCRFEEHRINKKKDIDSKRKVLVLTAASLLFSYCAISLSPHNINLKEAFILLAVLASVSTLCTQFYYGYQNFALKAREFHVCGILLQNLYFKIKVNKNVSSNDLKNYVSEFNYYLGLCSYNHTTKAFEKVENEEKNKNKRSGNKIASKNTINNKLQLIENE